MKIDINTKMITLLGKPLGQSFAARMQNAGYEAAGLNMLYFYTEVDKDHLGDVVNGLRYMNFAGFAVTKPNKVRVLRYLDELDPLCKKMGASNTVVKTPEGKLIGYPAPWRNKVRTFCQNPGGFVSQENYDGGLAVVNGHSYKERKSENTNLAILCTHNFLEPFNQPIAYAKKIGELCNALGAGRVCYDLARIIKADLPAVRCADGGRDLFAGIAFKNAAQKALEGSIIAVHRVGHMRRVRHCKASCFTS